MGGEEEGGGGSTWYTIHLSFRFVGGGGVNQHLNIMLLYNTVALISIWDIKKQKS